MESIARHAAPAARAGPPPRRRLRPGTRTRARCAGGGGEAMTYSRLCGAAVRRRQRAGFGAVLAAPGGGDGGVEDVGSGQGGTTPPLAATVELHGPARVPITHAEAYSLHYVLAGHGTAVACRGGLDADDQAPCDDPTLSPLQPGDSVLFPPGAAHVIRPDAEVGSIATLAIVLPAGAGGLTEAREYATGWAQKERVGELTEADVRLLLGIDADDDVDSQGDDEAGDDGAGGGTASGEAALLKRGLAELVSFKPPNGDRNRIALVYDGSTQELPFTFALEIFQPGHRTPPHMHAKSHELFFILKGDGEAYCEGSERVAVAPGDLVIMPPGRLHGIDAGASEPLFCLELMLNDAHANFGEFVRSGEDVGGLQDDDLCSLIHVGCAQ